MNANVPACGSMVFEGTLRCANDGSRERCVAEPGVNYCRFGAGADDDEWDTPDCGGGGSTSGGSYPGCCDFPGPPPMSPRFVDGWTCAGEIGETDICEPNRVCTWDKMSATTGVFFCALRDTDCAPAFCYLPENTNEDTSAGEVCD